MTSSSLVFHCGSVIVQTLTFVSLHSRHNSLPYLELRVYNGYTSEKLNSRSLHFFAADHTARAYVCFLFRATLLNFGFYTSAYSRCCAQFEMVRYKICQKGECPSSGGRYSQNIGSSIKALKAPQLRVMLARRFSYSTMMNAVLLMSLESMLGFGGN